MIPSVPVLAACGPEEIALGAVAVIATFLFGLFLVMRKKLRDSLVERTRTEFSEELLAKFRRGMETSIPNPSIKELRDTSKSMLAILKQLGLSPDSVASLDDDRL